MQSRRVVSAVANERTRVTNVGNHLGQINFDSRETESFKTRAEEKAKSCQVNHKNRPTFRSLNGEICYLSWRLWKLYTCIFVQRANPFRFHRAFWDSTQKRDKPWREQKPRKWTWRSWLCVCVCVIQVVGSTYERKWIGISLNLNTEDIRG